MAQDLAPLNSSADPADESADNIFCLLKISGHNTIYVDQHGDLELVVGTGEESRTFRVLANVMRLTSPVWRAMLSTEYNFMEASNTTREITFPEDDVASAFIVLLVGHLRLLEIPTHINGKRLANLCVLCDKYDCITVLRPWLAIWMPSLSENWGKTGPLWDCAMIAWVIGDASRLKIATNELVKWCTVDDYHRFPKFLGTALEGRLPYGLSGQYSPR